MKRIFLHRPVAFLLALSLVTEPVLADFKILQEDALKRPILSCQVFDQQAFSTRAIHVLSFLARSKSSQRDPKALVLRQEVPPPAERRDAGFYSAFVQPLAFLAVAVLSGLTGAPIIGGTVYRRGPNVQGYARLYQLWEELLIRMRNRAITESEIDTLRGALVLILTGDLPPAKRSLVRVFAEELFSPAHTPAIRDIFITAVQEMLAQPPFVPEEAVEVLPEEFISPIVTPVEELPPAPDAAVSPPTGLPSLLVMEPAETKIYRLADTPQLQRWVGVLNGIKNDIPAGPGTKAWVRDIRASIDLTRHGIVEKGLSSTRDRSPFVGFLRRVVDVLAPGVSDEVEPAPEHLNAVIDVRLKWAQSLIEQRNGRTAGIQMPMFSMTLAVGWVFGGVGGAILLTLAATLLGMNIRRLIHGVRVFIENSWNLRFGFLALIRFLWIRAGNEAAYRRGELHANVPAELADPSQSVDTLTDRLFPDSMRRIRAARKTGLFSALDIAVDPKHSFGPYLAISDKDAKGQSFRFLDFGGFGALAYGYNRLEIINALLRNFASLVDRLAHSEYQSTLSLDFMDWLGSVAPEGCPHAFICNTGAEAVENSIKAAHFRQELDPHQPPTGDYAFLIHFVKAFHGRTLGALGVTESIKARLGFTTFQWPKVNFASAKFSAGTMVVDEELRRREERSLKETWDLIVKGQNMDKRRPKRSWESDRDAIDAYLTALEKDLEGVTDKETRKRIKAERIDSFVSAQRDVIKARYAKNFTWADNVSGIIVEPIQCEGGIRFASPRYYQHLRMLSKLYDLPLIFDEVQTGNGRTGTLWNFEQMDLPAPPDIVVTAKVAQMGIVFLSEDMSKFFEKEKAFNTTWAGEPAGMIKYPVYIHLLDMNAIKKIGRYAVAELLKIQEKYPHRIVSVRSQGVLIGFSVAGTDDRDASNLRDLLQEELFRRGLILNRAGEDTLRYYPRYDARESDIDESIGIIDAGLKALAAREGYLQAAAVAEPASSGKINPNRMGLMIELITRLRRLRQTPRGAPTPRSWVNVEINKLSRQYGLSPREVKEFLTTTGSFERQVSPLRSGEEPLRAEKGHLLFNLPATGRRAYQARLMVLENLGRTWALESPGDTPAAHRNPVANLPFRMVAIASWMAGMLLDSPGVQWVSFSLVAASIGRSIAFRLRGSSAPLLRAA